MGVLCGGGVLGAWDRREAAGCRSPLRGVCLVGVLAWGWADLRSTYLMTPGMPCLLKVRYGGTDIEPLVATVRCIANAIQDNWWRVVLPPSAGGSPPTTKRRGLFPALGYPDRSFRDGVLAARAEHLRGRVGRKARTFKVLPADARVPRPGQRHPRIRRNVRERAAAGRPAQHPFHSEPLLNSRGAYENLDIAVRKKLLHSFAAMVRYFPISYRTFTYRRSEYEDPAAGGVVGRNLLRCDDDARGDCLYCVQLPAWWHGAVAVLFDGADSESAVVTSARSGCSPVRPACDAVGRVTGQDDDVRE